MNSGPSTRFVKDIVADFRSKELVEPDYQREYVWGVKQAAHFLSRTIQLGHVLGVITTYRLEGGATNFLQDGLQRVTTLMRAIDRPSDYGLTKEDVDCIKIAQVSQQSMIYSSHDLARMDFQHLNSGVGLIPYEKYRGDLESDEQGRLLYEMVRTSVGELSVTMAGISRASDPGRKKKGQLYRNSLGLFFQYVTRHTSPVLYAKSERNLDEQIERRVRQWLDDNCEDWRSEFNSFVRMLERVNATLTEKTIAVESKRWDMTAVRAMYAAATYCRNTRVTADVFDALVDWFIQCNRNRKTWSARFEVEIDGEPRIVRMDQVSLLWLQRVSETGGPEISCRKRAKRFVARAGYDESHIIPHADGGVETVSEPATANRARGRNPMQD